MKNKILFAQQGYNYLKISDILKLIFILLIFSVGMLLAIELTAPFWLDKISFTADYAKPFVILFSISFVCITSFVIIFYKIQTTYSFWAIKSIIFFYISMGLLFCSLFIFDGNNIYFQNWKIILLKFSSYIFWGILNYIFTIKHTIPQIEKEKANYSSIYTSIAVSLTILGSYIIKSNIEINTQIILPAAYFILACCFITKFNTCTLKLYYSKLYKLF